MVLNQVGLRVDEGELISLVGPNGAGKTSLLRAVSGLVKWEKDTLRGTTSGKISLKGSVVFNGEEMTKLPAHQIAKRGLILCPERGKPFREMTVLDNLRVGGYLCKDKETSKKTLEMVYELFPILKSRTNQISGALSGGERTMLSIGRSLMSQARLLLIDEPSTGLAPMVKEDLFTRINQVHGLGITILLVEQDVGFAFDLATRNYVMSRGQIIAEGTSSELLDNELIRKTYLGL
ncbi:MAG: ABC transporter ATP-binding protein [Deltaproteobacteria bacterium]|nr:ABC transporter ATP-binding protein [Deltaproteobacteria bacterium]